MDEPEQLFHITVHRCCLAPCLGPPRLHRGPPGCIEHVAFLVHKVFIWCMEFLRFFRRLSQRSGAKLQRAARVIFVPPLSHNQQSAITLILYRSCQKSLALLSYSLSISGEHTHTHTLAVSGAVFQEAECDEIYWYMVWPSSHGSMLSSWHWGKRMLIIDIIKAQFSVCWQTMHGPCAHA